jgi:hypothetical protein
MKRQIFYVAILLICCSCTKNEKLLVGGSNWNRIAIIDKSSGKIEWNHPLEAEEECNDVEMTPKGEILYAYKQGARLVKRDHKVVWDYKANDSEYLYTATRLKSGNYMLAMCGSPARIVELDKNGNLVTELTFNTATPDIQNQFRQILKTPHNTYLIPMMDKHKISEIDESGKVVRSYFCGGNPYSIKLTDEGNWLISCGDDHKFMEVDPENRSLVNTVETSNLSWGSLLYVAELIRYKNGNTLIANWSGHSDDKTQPLLFELDPTNQIVWRLPSTLEITGISTVYSFFD